MAYRFSFLLDRSLSPSDNPPFQSICGAVGLLPWFCMVLGTLPPFAHPVIKVLGIVFGTIGNEEAFCLITAVVVE